MVKQNARKTKPKNPTLVLDQHAISIKGFTTQLKWKDVVSVANARYDSAAKGRKFDAIQFVVRGGLKFFVRKKDVIWAESRLPVDIKDIHALPQCTYKTWTQLKLRHRFFTESKVAQSRAMNLKWAISFGKAIRNGGLDLRIDEVGFAYEISAQLKGHRKNGEPDLLEWLYFLRKQMHNLIKDDFIQNDKTNSVAEKKTIVAAYLAVANAFEDYAFYYMSIPHKKDSKRKDPKWKALKEAADKKSHFYFCAVYDALRNAEIWERTYKHKDNPNEDCPFFAYDMRMLICSDRALDFSAINGVTIPGVGILTQVQIEQEIKLHHYVFPAGHPKQGEIYVQDPKDEHIFTELTPMNTGTFTIRDISRILTEVKELFPKRNK